jgi:hypothetical protein
MKRKLKTLLITMLLCAAPFILVAQEPPHPNGGNAPTPGGNTPVGGSAPIDGGLSIILALSAMYAGKNVLHFGKEEE